MTVWQWLADAGVSIIPPVLVGIVFWILMRSILRADSTERKVYSQIEAEERAKAAAAAESKPAKSKN